MQEVVYYCVMSCDRPLLWIGVKKALQKRRERELKNVMKIKKFHFVTLKPTGSGEMVKGHTPSPHA